jgi:hypothetical protein
VPDDFRAAFAELRDILKRHSTGMLVKTDTPTDFTLVTSACGPNKQPMWFGAVLLKKSAVTYHLMPLYYNPTLQAAVPAELLARKQGKSCFNFRRPDADLFAKLDALTQRSRDAWAKYGFLDPGPITPERMNAALRAGGEDPDALAKLRKSKGKQAAAKRAATLKNKEAASRSNKSAKRA